MRRRRQERRGRRKKGINKRVMEAKRENENKVEETEKKIEERREKRKGEISLPFFVLVLLFPFLLSRAVSKLSRVETKN